MMVFITGASGGLGRAMAIESARRGFDLFLTDLRQDALEIIRTGIRRQYDVAIDTWACNLLDAAAVAGLFAEIDRRGIRPDMLLNIAGIDYEGGFLSRDCQSLVSIVQLNIEATLRITHDILKRRNPLGSFYLVFVSSLASLYPMPLKATYAASKRFLLDFSLALGQELKQEQVQVLCLCPGGLPTTEEAHQGIAAQGLGGILTTNRLELVASRTLSSVMAGRRLYFPGRINGMLRFLGYLTPRAAVVRLIHHRWLAAQKHWLNPA